MADYGVYRITRGWVENEADWNSAADGIPWTNPGGDYVSEALDQQQDVSKSEGTRWISFNVVDAVKDFVAHPDENFGFLIKNDFFSMEMDVASSEYEDTSLHPKLTIEYAATAVDYSRKRIAFNGSRQPVTLITAGQQLRIANGGVAPVTIALTRLDGTIVSSGLLQGGTRKTLSAGSGGVYLISVYGNNQILHKKISLFP